MRAAALSYHSPIGKSLFVILQAVPAAPVSVWGDLAGRNGPDLAFSETRSNSASKVFPCGLPVDKVGLSGVFDGRHQGLHRPGDETFCPPVRNYFS